MDRNGLAAVAGWLAAATACSTLAAQVPQVDSLLLDIREGPPLRARGSHGEPLGAGGGFAWFSALSTATGREPWVSDGSPSGTRALGDLEPGPDSSDPRPGLWLSDGVFVFSARTSAHGYELFAAHATTGNAQLIGDLLPGPFGSHPSVPVEWRGEAWFVASTAVPGNELWRSDGSAAGTRRHDDSPRELPPGHVGRLAINGRSLRVAGSSLFFVSGWRPARLLVKDDPDAPPRQVTSTPVEPDTAEFFGVDLDGRLLFPGRTVAAGRELWASDGTAAGTRLVFDANPGVADSAWRLLAADGARAWFAVGTPATGAELWVSDGTPAGTRQVVELAPGPASGIPVGASAVVLPGGDLLFSGTRPGSRELALWRSDGTVAGTIRVADPPGSPRTWQPRELRCFGGGVWLLAPGPAGQPHLWHYDPDLGAVTSVTGASAGPGLLEASAALGAVAARGAGERVLFVGQDRRFGAEPWSTTSEPSSAELLADIVRDGSPGSLPSTPMRHHDVAIFAADDGVIGKEPWVTDGTSAGTRLLEDLVPGGDGSDPVPLGSLSGGLVLAAMDVSSRAVALWVTDGAPGSVRRLSRLGAPLRPGQLLHHRQAGSRALLTLRTFGGIDLWVTDGTESGTHLLSGGEGLSFAEPMVAVGTRVYGRASRSGDDHELLVVDLAAATVEILDVRRGPLASWPRHLAAAGDRVVFSALDPADSVELFAAGGTPVRVERLTNLAPGLGSAGIRSTASLGDHALFITNEPHLAEHRLWRTDGTLAGTRPLAQAALPAALVTGASHLMGAGGVCYFWADPNRTRRFELWTTDGTGSGTRLVRRAPAPGVSWTPSAFTPLADGREVLFTGPTAQSGEELWISDGTAAGTRILTDAWPGPEDGSPGSFAQLGSTLLFAATDGVSGRELHRLDMRHTGAHAATRIGAACGASWTVHGQARLGRDDFVAEIHAAPAAPVLVVVGAGLDAQPLGSSGCDSMLAHPVLFAIAGTDPVTGAVQLPLPLARMPTPLGRRVILQAVALVDGGPVYGSMQTTPALEVLIGS